MRDLAPQRLATVQLDTGSNLRHPNGTGDVAVPCYRTQEASTAPNLQEIGFPGEKSGFPVTRHREPSKHADHRVLLLAAECRRHRLVQGPLGHDRHATAGGFRW